ncbi:MAG: hypothetical protein ACI9SP_001833 [Arenicella sp.]|jgi:hypothetical protein
MNDVAIDRRKRERPIVLVTGPTKTIKFTWWRPDYNYGVQAYEVFI